MNTKFSNRIEEAKYLADWCVEILKFIDTLQPHPNLSLWIDDMYRGVKKIDVVGLRMTFNDMNESTQDLTYDQYKTLDKILKDKFGEGLFEADKKHVKRINKIVEKGKIKTEVQYYLLREYFERIWDMIEYKNTAGKIEKMLYVFENKIKK